MAALLFLLFLVVPIAEIYVLIQVGHAIGAQWTVLLLLADSLLGMALVRAQGRGAWRRLNAALAEGRVPAREVLDGGLVMLGGALLLAPGFITDVFGIVLLAPPSRALVRRGIGRRVGSRLWGRGVPRRRRSRSSGRRRPYDVEGSAVDVDEGRLP